MTLAAWNDSEFASSTFTAGRFDIVGATNGSSFSDHNPDGTPSTPAAALTFSVPVAAMAPGNTTYALFSVKTANPSVAGTVLLSSVSTTGTGLGTYLRYGVKRIDGTACNESAYIAGTATTVIADGSMLSAGASASQTVNANGANQVNYCFRVTLPPGTSNDAQGLTATQTWRVQGTSS